MFYRPTFFFLPASVYPFNAYFSILHIIPRILNFAPLIFFRIPTWVFVFFIFLEPPRFVSVTFLLVLTNCLILCLSPLGTCQFVVLPAVFVFSKPLGSRLAYSYLFQPVISLIWKSKGESRYIRLS